MSNTSAYKKGWDAYYSGVIREDCPYDPDRNYSDSQRAEDWDRGWIAAEQQDYADNEGDREQMSRDWQTGTGYFDR